MNTIYRKDINISPIPYRPLQKNAEACAAYSAEYLSKITCLQYTYKVLVGVDLHKNHL